MKLMFVYYAFEDQGSGLVIQGYSEAARELGHEVVVYGKPNPKIRLNYSLDVESADALVFIFEWTMILEHSDNLDFLRLVGHVPRSKRVILDGDGNYNDRICVSGDCNHSDAAASQRWVEICDSLSDKICQPTLHPLRPNVRSFMFYAYNPRWERPLTFDAKDYDMVYVGHSKFRWGPMERVLRAIEPIRGQMGRIALVGHGWDALPWWAVPMQLQDAYFSEPSYLRELGIEFAPAIPFEQVIDWMSRATFNPLLSRPTFSYLRLVTPRFFETPAANTIPLIGHGEAHAQAIYGDEALELVLPAEQPEEKILDMIHRPQYYAGIVRRVRQHLARNHSHMVRLRELIEIVES